MPQLRSKPAPLKKLQGWFQGEIVGAARNRKPAKEILLPSRTLEARERMDIYTRMYFFRLHDCLIEDFPTLVEVLGHERFDRMIRLYLAKYPSKHYSLNFLGRRMPDFLSKNVPVPRRAALRDIAILENAMSEVFDERESPVLDPKTLANFPPQKWEKARLKLISAFRLLTLDYPANAIVTAVRNENPIPKFSRRRCHVAVYRKNYKVWRMELSEPMFVLLSALQKGKRLREALFFCSKVWKGKAEELERSVFQWFAEWSGEGFFSEISA